MNLQVGDVYQWKDRYWDELVIYRGKSFSPAFEWFDFLVGHKPDYEHGGFHAKDHLDIHLVMLITHLPNVAPVEWVRTEDNGFRKK